MYLKPAQLTINPEDPFEADELNRRESAEVLTQLIQKIEVPFVLAVDSPWGTGKTTFVTMWMCHLKAAGYPCLYFNAWETDFTEDPLVSFMGEIETGIDLNLLQGDSQTKAKQYWKVAKVHGASLAKKVVPVAIKLATAGLVDLDAAAQQALADVAADLAREKIDRYQKDKETISGFREQLRGFVKEVSTSGTYEGKSLVIFVDELDRCRPTYAIELLERIKHFFDVEGIIFVLSLDKSQIGHSIRSVYGTSMDVDGYLRRFIDLDYHLPEPPRLLFPKFLSERFNLVPLLETRGEARPAASKESDELIEMFSQLADIFGLSLRVQEQCFTRLTIAIATTAQGQRLYLPYLGALVVLKAADTKLYTDFVAKKAGIQQVLEFIGQTPKGKSFLDGRHGTALEVFFMQSRTLEDQEVGVILKRYRQQENEIKISEQGRKKAHVIVQAMASSIVGPDPGSYDEAIEYLAQKIALSERFTS